MVREAKEVINLITSYKRIVNREHLAARNRKEEMLIDHSLNLLDSIKEKIKENFDCKHSYYRTTKNYKPVWKCTECKKIVTKKP